MREYVCEIWVSNARTGGDWLRAEDSSWGTQDEAIDTALEWDREGYIVRIKGRDVVNA